MTLAGLVIALGAVVDDAIIDVENIVRRLRQHRLAGGSRVAPAVVILEASLEVRSPIVYATLIIVAAAVPVFLLQGLTGAFFRPLAVSYTLAIVASMVVALTVTPALTLILLRNAPDRAARVAGRPRAAARLQPAARAGSSAGPRRRYAACRRVTARRRWSWSHSSGQSLFPAFKERDFLMHWVTSPGTSDAEMERTTTRRQQGAARHPRGAQLRRAHRPGAPRRGGRRRQPRRELDQHRPVRRLRRRRSARIAGGRRRATRACSARRPDLPRRADRGGPHRRQGADRRPRLRRGPRRCCGRRPTRSTRCSRGIDGVDGRTRRHLQPTCRRSRSRSTSPRPQRVRPQARRRAARRGHPGRRRGGRRHLPGGQGLRRRGLEHARRPATA